MRHSRRSREEISNEAFSNPLDTSVLAAVAPNYDENPLSDGAKVAIGVGVLAAVGIGAYFLLKPSTAAATSSSGAVPDVGTAGPYKPVLVTPASASVPVAAPYMQQGETYLLSMPPISGLTLATAVSNLQKASAQGPNVATTGAFTVLQSWDVNQVPASWPSSDSSPNEWRMVITLAGGTQPLPVPIPGANLFSTGGAIAGVGYRPSVDPSDYRGASAGMTEMLRADSRDAIGIGYRPSVDPSHYRETSQGLTEMLSSSSRLAGVGQHRFIPTHAPGPQGPSYPGGGGHLAPPIIERNCPPGMVWSTQARQCILAPRTGTSGVGAMSAKPVCPPGSQVVAGRCFKVLQAGGECPAGTFFDPTTYNSNPNAGGCVSSLWQLVSTNNVPVNTQSDFANWYNGSGARPQPLPAGMASPPAGAWTAVAVIQGGTYYFAARLTAGVGVQWWMYNPQVYRAAAPRVQSHAYGH